MSSYWGACHGDGCFLTRSEYETLIENYIKKNNIQEDDAEIIREDSVDWMPMLSAKYAGKNILSEDMISNLISDTADTSEAEKNNPNLIFHVNYIDSDAEGLAIIPFLDENGNFNKNYMEDTANIEYVIWASKNRVLGDAFENPPYASFEDYVREFEDKIGEYMPADFNIKNHLGIISYAIFA